MAVTCERAGCNEALTREDDTECCVMLGERDPGTLFYKPRTSGPARVVAVWTGDLCEECQVEMWRAISDKVASVLRGGLT